jgi:hypothetical protein
LFLCSFPTLAWPPFLMSAHVHGVCWEVGGERASVLCLPLSFLLLFHSLRRVSSMPVPASFSSRHFWHCLFSSLALDVFQRYCQDVLRFCASC